MNKGAQFLADTIFLNEIILLNCLWSNTYKIEPLIKSPNILLHNMRNWLFLKFEDSFESFAIYENLIILSCIIPHNKNDNWSPQKQNKNVNDSWNLFNLFKGDNTESCLELVLPTSWSSIFGSVPNV